MIQSCRKSLATTASRNLVVWKHNNRIKENRKLSRIAPFFFFFCAVVVAISQSDLAVVVR